MSLDFESLEGPRPDFITCDGCTRIGPVIVKRAEGSLGRVYYYCYKCLEEQILRYHASKLKAEKNRAVVIVFNKLNDLRDTLGLSDDYEFTGASYDPLTTELSICCKGPGLRRVFPGGPIFRCNWLTIKENNRNGRLKLLEDTSE